MGLRQTPTMEVMSRLPAAGFPITSWEVSAGLAGPWVVIYLSWGSYGTSLKQEDEQERRMQPIYVVHRCCPQWQ